MKTATQVKDKIKNMAKQKQIDPLILTKNYMMERFLERISLSRFRDHFILKGGFLIASVVGIDSRSTVDIDTTLKNYPLNSEILEKVISEILDINCDDHISMALKKLETIHEEGDYTGCEFILKQQLTECAFPLRWTLQPAIKSHPKR